MFKSIIIIPFCTSNYSVHSVEKSICNIQRHPTYPTYRAMESVSQVGKHVAGQHATATDQDDDASCHSETENSQRAAMTPEKIEEIGKRESKAVFWSRIAVLAVLVAAAVCVSLTVFFYMYDTVLFDSIDGL
jgi:hypothetical protein